MFNFKIIKKGKSFASDEINTGYLRIDDWNDYSFVTMFYLTVFDGKGEKHEIGNIRIGFKGQEEGVKTHEKLNKIFSNLTGEYFSLGNGLDFYKNMNALDDELKDNILTSLNDIVIKPNILSDIENERVLNNSLLRSVTLSDINGQFARVLNGFAELSNFDFDFKRRSIEGFSDLNISFNVEVGSTPSTNIHAFIGRNGCGKTTILNEMIEAITEPTNEQLYFTDNDKPKDHRIPKGYFRSLVSVSFSAFDPFSPPKDQSDPAKGTQYFYIGLKSPEINQKLKSLDDLRLEFVAALIGSLRDENKNKIWSSAIEKLSSDQNFANMELSMLKTKYKTLSENNSNIQVDSHTFKDLLYKDIGKYLSRMSSGHAIVLFTITRLVDTVGEKSLVLLDEPEGHLHPPLLSAFLRTLSDLLDARNGVAIIATHSPVVLQEIPKSCVWKVIRSRESINVRRPDIETFGENLGVLTREVFSLEVANSGYHYLLSQLVESGLSYKEILLKYKNQIGLEGRAVLKAMVMSRDEGERK